MILSLGRCLMTKSSKMGVVKRDDYRFFKIADGVVVVN